MGRSKKRVVMFAEAVTLAHVARPLSLAGALDPAMYEVIFVSDRPYERFIASSGWRTRVVESISPARFMSALAAGRPIYDVDTLERYVEEDLRVLSELAPDVVVGDFRLSLSASARLARIPYVSIASAYWSPYAHVAFPIPEHPLVRRIGVGMAQRAFDIVRPFVFARHARPLNRVRKRHGLTSLGADLRRTYTDADFVLYADPSELVPLLASPPNHRHLGPILWSPPVDLPSALRDIRADRPLLYVTMGSSGSSDTLGVVLGALGRFECTVVAATAGARVPFCPPNAVIAEYMPGADVSARASLVICNGGSPTSHQALAAGVPVLGIPANLDQHLNMAGIQRAGAGLTLRSDQVSERRITEAARHLLDTPSFVRAARELADAFRRYDARAVFRSAVAEALEVSG